nr:hypothetical protein [Haloechinothrix sp. LS1_15]
MNADHPGRSHLVDQAQRALVAIRAGTDTDALTQVDAECTRDLVTLLFAECSAMVAALGDGGATPVRVQVFDEAGTEVSIDAADPPIRTAVRTLLAEVHGKPADAKEQVEIALANAAPEEISSLVLQALRWTSRLADECLDRDIEIAPWIVDALRR